MANSTSNLEGISVEINQSSIQLRILVDITDTSGRFYSQTAFIADDQGHRNVSNMICARVHRVAPVPLGHPINKVYLEKRFGPTITQLSPDDIIVTVVSSAGEDYSNLVIQIASELIIEFGLIRDQVQVAIISEDSTSRKWYGLEEISAKMAA